MQIHARIYSLGGGVLAGIALVLGATSVLAFTGSVRHGRVGTAMMILLLALLLYASDAWSETLTITDETLIFDSWLKRARRFPLASLENVLLVHEGLNSEIGIESIVIRRKDGEERRLALGPLWRRRDLESFMHTLETRTGKSSLVEEVR